MKRVFGKVEAIFDIGYLLAAAGIGIALLYTGRITMGVMALLLAGGDSFHLIPRVITIMQNREEEMRRYLGRGKQITSLTMTIFYLLLIHVISQYSGIPLAPFWMAMVYLLVSVRIILCFFPQNRWEDRYPPVSWGIIRNIPFFLLGLLVSWQLFVLRFSLCGMRWAWLAVLLSFICYLPVVMWANKNPKIGMLMLPKTCMYLWLLIMFLNT